MTYITIATEDELSEAVAERLIHDYLSEFAIHKRLRRGGNGYLKEKCNAFNNMAARTPVLLITDLDQRVCAKSLIDDWFPETKLNEHLIFRIAVREIESWLLSDITAMGALLGKGGTVLNNDPETIDHPKEYLLNLARKAPAKIRQELVREKNSIVYQALSYNARLTEFVFFEWSPERALLNSDSLKRAIYRLKEYADNLTE